MCIRHNYLHSCGFQEVSPKNASHEGNLLCGRAAQRCAFKLGIQEAERDMGSSEVDIHMCMFDMIVIYLCYT